MWAVARIITFGVAPVAGATNSVVWLVLEASAIARMVSILDMVFWQLCIVVFDPLFLTLQKNNSYILLDLVGQFWIQLLYLAIFCEALKIQNISKKYSFYRLRVGIK